MNFICCSDYRTLSLEISFPSGTCMFYSTCKVEPRLGVRPHSVSQDYRAESNEVSWRCFGACIVHTFVQQLLYAFFFCDLYGYNQVMYNIDDHWHSWAISVWVDEVSIWDNRLLNVLSSAAMKGFTCLVAALSLRLFPGWMIFSKRGRLQRRSRVSCQGNVHGPNHPWGFGTQQVKGKFTRHRKGYHVSLSRFSIAILPCHPRLPWVGNPNILGNLAVGFILGD